MLEALGLTDDEAELYVALVRSGPSPTDEFDRLPGLPDLPGAVVPLSPKRTRYVFFLLLPRR